MEHNDVWCFFKRGHCLKFRLDITQLPIIKGAWLHARTRPGGSNLTLERLAIKIWWQGYSGMKLRDVKPKLQTMSSFEEAIDRAVAAPMRNEWALYLDDSNHCGIGLPKII
jgi:hypothetical protein